MPTTGENVASRLTDEKAFERSDNVIKTSLSGKSVSHILPQNPKSQKVANTEQIPGKSILKQVYSQKNRSKTYKSNTIILTSL